MKKRKLTGINIQFPISQLILDGKKIIETRLYPIPPTYVDQEMALVETPGKSGKFKSRIIAIITFGPSVKYESETQFYKDSKRHCVTPDSPWAWIDSKPKWGWPIIKVQPLKKPVSVEKRLGIKYTKNLSI